MTKLHPMAVILFVAGFVAPYGTAHAEMLEPEECEALKTQQKSLLTPTVQSALTKGPDWVKDNLHDQEKIEQVREYLLVEEKLAFRCRTDGVRIPKPMPPPLPDRKPAVPTFVVAGVDATSLMPLRNPSREAADAIASVLSEEGEGEGDIDNGLDEASKDEDPGNSGLASAAGGVNAAGEALAKDEAAIRQGLAKP
ncbi:hypothetical protein AUC70_06755 [Methyloceanibacter stevinii]|uniref:Uncharacterized protein n=2 Tax=Methyloceanibacter stevinii TaxID=1774970 RepID=A0A1E3VLI7_9HYPH|nr:hypothetical protein AUC70_06755 [Methyloceanibacter stevinii]